MDLDTSAPLPTPSSTFYWDVDSYSSRYQGLGKVLRLKALAQHTNDPSIRIQAVKLAVEAVIESNSDAAMYSSLCSLLSPAESEAAGVRFDPVVAENIRQASESKIAAIYKHLELQRALSLRENIRRGYIEYAQAHRDANSLEASVTALKSSQEYVTDSKQLLEASCKIADTALIARAPALVAAELSRPDIFAEAGPSMVARLKSYSAIACMLDGDFATAARHFFAVNSSALDSIATAAHHDEIAIYAGLCALAGLSRDELKSSVLASSSARQLLEPHSWLITALQEFVNGMYANVLQLVAKALPDLECDMFLERLAGKMFAKIKQQALKLYIQPYDAVDLRAMSTAVGIPLPEMEREVANLILSDTIAAKIDSDTKVLYAQKSDLRTAAHRAAFEAGHAFEEAARIIIFRSSMERHNLFVRGKIQRPADNAGPTGNSHDMSFR